MSIAKSTKPSGLRQIFLKYDNKRTISWLKMKVCWIFELIRQFITHKNSFTLYRVFEVMSRIKQYKKNKNKSWRYTMWWDRMTRKLTLPTVSEVVERVFEWSRGRQAMHYPCIIAWHEMRGFLWVKT